MWLEARRAHRHESLRKDACRSCGGSLPAANAGAVAVPMRRRRRARRHASADVYVRGLRESRPRSLVARARQWLVEAHRCGARLEFFDATRRDALTSVPNVTHWNWCDDVTIRLLVGKQAVFSRRGPGLIVVARRVLIGLAWTTRRPSQRADAMGQGRRLRQGRAARDHRAPLPPPRRSSIAEWRGSRTRPGTGTATERGPG